MKTSLLLLGLILSLQLGVLPAARADVVYTVTVVGGAGSAAYDVNNRGQVVGYMAAGETYHAFLYDAGILNDLGTLGNGVSFANRLNESGTVIGTSYVDDQPYAFTYANGAMTALSTGPGSYANDINNAGVIAGTYAGTDSDGFYQPHAYTYAGGAMTDLGTLGYGSYGNAINDHGQVAGTAEINGPPNRPTDPFFYSNGVMQNIGNFGGIFSNAWAMNNQGHVVGSAGGTPSDGSLYPFRAFLYDGSGLHDLGVMAKDGNSSAYGINELGQVVGFTDTDTGSATYLYTDGAMVLLDTLIDPASGWTITDANGINDLGQIAGRACKGELCYAVRLDLAAAVPEPGQATMLGFGLLLVLGRIARRKWSRPGATRSAWPARAWLPVAILALLIPVAGQAAPGYTVTVLGGAGSDARDINASGQVVGATVVDGVSRAFFYDGSLLNDLGTLGYEQSVATGLNDSGTVVGTASSGSWSQAFVHAGGTTSTLPFPDRSEANGINNAGVVVGTAAVGPQDSGWNLHGYTYANGVATDLGTIPDGYSSVAYAINEAGAVTGGVEWSGPTNFPTHPFLYVDGTMHDLGDFGGTFGYGYAINNHGQVVGAAGSPDSPDFPDDRYPRRAFLYENGVMQDLGSLVNNGSSAAYDINDAGQIVGYAATGYEGEIGAFLYEDGKMILVDTLLDPTAGWTVPYARAINDLGQIAGTACRAGLCYAVRLDIAPIPEPGQLSMLAVGSLALLRRRLAHGVKRWRLSRALPCAPAWT